jgi:hypothetical protein
VHATLGSPAAGSPPSALESGGGGSTFPQRSLNDPWGLSAQRANCAICHATDPRTDAFTFNRFGADWRRILFRKIAPGAHDIFDPTQAQRVQASVEAELMALDSDGDGYSNGVELMFGSDPGDPSSKSNRSAAQLAGWYERLGGAAGLAVITRHENDPGAQVSGRDTDRDAVPDELERFAGFDPLDRSSVPLTAARRLAAVRVALAAR